MGEWLYYYNFDAESFHIKKIAAVRCLLLSQSTRVTDGRTNGQADRITTPKTGLA